MNNPMLKFASALALVVSSAPAQVPAQALYMGLPAQSPPAANAPVTEAPPIVAVADPSNTPVPPSEAVVAEAGTALVLAGATPVAPPIAEAVPQSPGFGAGGAIGPRGGAMSGGLAARSPQIRMAEAELELAEAEHNKVCQDVARDATLAYQKWKRAQDEVKRAEQSMKEGLVPPAEKTKAEDALQPLEAELRRLLGMSIPTEQSGKLEFAALPESLEEAIAVALEKNADIKTAKAKVNLARLTVESEQMRVSQGVVSSSALAQEAKALDAKIEETQRRVAEGSESKDTLVELRAKADQLKQSSRQQMDPNIVSPPAVPIFVQKPFAEAPLKRPEMQPEMQEKLNIEISGLVAVDGDKTLQEVLDMVSLEMGGFNFVMDIEADSPAKLTLKLGSTSVRNVLLALSDQSDGICFVIRDYGILVTTRERAESINAPTIPEDVPLQMVRR